MELQDRLRRELTHDVSPETRARHLAAAAAASGLGWDATTAESSLQGRLRNARALRRRVATGLAAFGLVALPTAAMAQDALPGETLYPIKLAVEPIQALFDDDVVANHRADEAAALLADDTTSGEALERALSRAEEALADSNASDTARLRVAEVRARFEQQRAAKDQERADRDAAKDQERADDDRDAAKDQERADDDRGDVTDQERADDDRGDVTPDAPEVDDADGDDQGREQDHGRPEDAGNEPKDNGGAPANDRPKGPTDPRSHVPTAPGAPGRA